MSDEPLVVIVIESINHSGVFGTFNSLAEADRHLKDVGWNANSKKPGWWSKDGANAITQYVRPAEGLLF